MNYSVNHINNINYNTVLPVKSNKNKQDNTVCHAAKNSTTPAFTASQKISNIRTSLATREEKQKYSAVLKRADKQTKKQIEALLKNGILLNSNSNDNSTVLDNLYLLATTPRAEGLSQSGILRDTVATLTYPYDITQQFGDIPDKYRQKALELNSTKTTNYLDNINQNDIDVRYSGTCVAASIEFNLAKKMPAEFARFAQGLSSREMSINKTINMNNLADNLLDGVWLLNAFEIPFEMKGYEKALLKFAPDKNALLRAQIQTTDRDPYERSPLDVLMQSTFMNIGSQQSYNTLTDKRKGKFNQNDKGLIEFEKTFAESVVEDRNKISVTYQTVDDNARLIGYETDRETMRRHLTEALDMGENVIIGYTQVDINNVIINGHEITIVGYKKQPNGKLTFICNDTDDNISRPIEYDEDYLLPKIHHAALPKSVVANDLNITPTWVEGFRLYKQMKAEHDTTGNAAA